MKSKFLLIIFNYVLLGLLCFSTAQTQPWKKMQSPVTGTLRSISFIDSLTGWAAGEAGTIIHTTNGGEFWGIQNSTVQTFIMDIFFIDNNNGWALTIRDQFPFNSVLLKTTNGGTLWTVNDLPDSLGVVRTIFFFDPLSGFAGGSDILFSSDGGNSWSESEIDSNMVSEFPVHKFKFFNRQFGYACGGRIDVAGVIWKTTNYGFNWTAQGVSVDEIFDVFIFDSLNAITLSGDPEGLFPIGYVKTTNAGESWSFSDLPYFGLAFAIDFRTYNEGWSASGYKFLLTTDHGNSWNEFETPDSSTVYDLQFIDARTGFAVGENGVILKLDPSLVDVKSELTIPDKFILYQNYPNPFNSSTTIKFTIPLVGTQRTVSVQLKVYDILGNEIAILVNEEKSAGEYEVEFNALTGIRPLVSGIYFYQLKTAEFVEIKKMIYLK